VTRPDLTPRIVALLLPASLAGILALPAFAVAPFSEALPIATIDGSRVSLAVDIDRDGDLDLVAARSQGIGQLFWFENRGDLGFESRDVDLADSASGVAAGDLDRDGDPDLVVARFGIDWYENEDGVFTEREVSGDGDSYSDVVVIDLDRDGHLDVVSCGTGVNRVAWHRNLGNLTFNELPIATSGNGVANLDVVDMDRDGDLDVLSAWPADNRFSWHENDGDGAFTERIVTQAENVAADVVGSDFDGDGDVDFVTGSAGSNRVSWWENDGAQGFARRTISTQAIGVRRVAVGDLDNDGDLDAIATSEGDTTLAWYEASGVGSFTERLLSTTFAGPSGLDVADLDGDGDRDLVATSAVDDRLVWFENRNAHDSAIFPAAIGIDDAAPDAASVDAGDIDRDGDVDVVAAIAGGDQVRWYEGDGVGAFVVHALSSPADSVADVVAVELHDLDADGDLDVLSASPTGGDLVWFRNDGADEGWPQQVVDLAAAGVAHATAGDLDRDGVLDLVAAVSDEDAVFWYRGVRTIAGTTFGPGVAVASGALAVRSVELGDLDRDGALDVVFGEEGGGEFDSFEWLDGDGGSPPAFVRRNLSLLSGPMSVPRIADVDLDGLPDVLATHAAQDELNELRNTGGSPPEFPTTVIHAGFSGASDVEVVDLDRRGHADFLVAASDADRIYWFDDRAALGERVPRALPPNVNGVADVVVADVDGDGTADLVAALANANRIVWLPNRRAIFWDDFEGAHPFLWTVATP
jgi:hypothetical protein